MRCTAKPSRSAASDLARAGQISLADLCPSQELLTDPRAQSALLGLIEVRRNRAVVLRIWVKTADAQAALTSASDLARGNGLSRPIVNARLFRTSARDCGGAGAGRSGAERPAAIDRGVRPVAAWLEAVGGHVSAARGQLVKAGKGAAALPICQNAVRSLTTLKAGTTPALMAACLDVYAAAADRQASQAQTLLAEMFTAAQLAQGGITSQQIAQATARLSENSRDPEGGRSDSPSRRTRPPTCPTLYRQRDERAEAQRQGATTAPNSTGRRSRQSDRRRAGGVGRCRRGLAGGLAELWPARAAGGAGERRVRRAASRRGVRRDRPEQRGRLGVPAARRRRSRCRGSTPASAEIADLVRRVRAGIELTIERSADLRRRRCAEALPLTIGGVAGSLDGVKSLVVAPAGPLLSLPFEVLLTGPAQPDALADAPWLVRKFTLAHVPAPSNFVSLRKIAAGSRATQSVVRLRRLPPGDAGAGGEDSFSGAGCGDSARLLAGLPPLPYARKELEAARALLGASAVGRAARAGLYRGGGAEGEAEELPHPAIRHARAAADRTALPERAGHRHLGAGRCGRRVGRTADRVRSGGTGSGRRSGDPVGVQLGRSRAARRRAKACRVWRARSSMPGARSLEVTHWSVNDQVAAFLVADTLRRMHDSPSLRRCRGAARRAARDAGGCREGICRRSSRTRSSGRPSR